MMLSEVLRDTCWCLRRQDLEALLLADKAHSNFINRNFHKNGPRRLISSASLTANLETGDRGFSATSNEEVKNASSIENCCCYLRNSFVALLSLNSRALNETMIDAFNDLKGAYELDDLTIEVCIGAPGAASQVRLALSDAFCCRTVFCSFDYYPSKDYVEAVAAQELMPTIFSSPAIVGAHYLTLREISSCDSRLVAEWLHGATNDVPRRLVLTSDSCEFDATTLVDVLTEKFANDTCPRRYEFNAVGEHIGGVDEVRNESLENSNEEILKITRELTCFEELWITRRRK